MKRQVDLLVSPKWLASFFQVEVAPDTVPTFDPIAPGEHAGGQVRVPVIVDVADGVEMVEGELRILEFPPAIADKIGYSKAVVGTGVRPLRIHWTTSGRDS